MEYTGLSLEEIDDYLKNTVGVNGGLESTTRHKVDHYEQGYGVAYVKDNASDEKAFYFATSHYDSDGQRIIGMTWGSVKNTSNVDVHEQSALTFVSNLQDQARIHGDKLSTDAQLMTTKMQQVMQESNANMSACTQSVKAVCDIYKSVTVNVH
jgi:hypothetical protein